MFVGWMYDNGQQQSQRIDNHMTFSPGDFLAWIAPALRAALPSRVDRLGVDTEGFLGCRAGTWTSASRNPCGPTHPVAKASKQANAGPLPKVMIDRLPRREVGWKHTPLAAGLQQVKDRAQHVSRMVLVKTKAIKDRLDLFPLCVRQIQAIPRGRRSVGCLVSSLRISQDADGRFSV